MPAEKLDNEIVLQLIEGMSEACREAGMALIGGETAQMSNVYAPGEYDLAGTIVGIVPGDEIIDGRSIKAGDAIIGLPSSGLHTNGYTLARKVLLEESGYALADIPEGWGSFSGAGSVGTASFLSQRLPSGSGFCSHQRDCSHNRRGI